VTLVGPLIYSLPSKPATLINHLDALDASSSCLDVSLAFPPSLPRRLDRALVTTILGGAVDLGLMNEEGIRGRDGGE
jgi:hypothetical protein